MTSLATIDKDGNVDLSDAVADFGIDSTTSQYVAKVCVDDAPIYVMEVEDDGSLTGKKLDATKTTVTQTPGTTTTEPKEEIKFEGLNITGSKNVMIDYYVDLPGDIVYEADITADEFAGYYYAEGDVLVRRQDNGKDMPGSLTIPNAKLQSNFTITMASTGDPSTFDFTLDAFPAYTYFDKTKKVLAVVQIVDTDAAVKGHGNPVMPHNSVHEHDVAGLHNDIFDGATNAAEFKAEADANNNLMHLAGKKTTEGGAG